MDPVLAETSISDQFKENRQRWQVSFPISIATTSALLARNDFATIIKSTDHFLALFCKICAEKKIYTDSLRIPRMEETEDEDTLTVSGSGAYIFDIYNTIEKIRYIFQKYLDEKLSFIIVRNPLPNGMLHLIEESKEFLKYQCQIDQKLFNTIIHPCMEQLSASVGATCRLSSVDQGEASFPRSAVEHLAYSITWRAEPRFLYPIDLKKIPERASAMEELYGRYKTGRLCDFRLQSKEGDEIKMHRIILDIYGGEVLRPFLEGEMKESTEKRIIFSQFSTETLSLVVEYLYRGKEALSRDDTIDLQQLSPLICFGHMYEVPSLVDCCTNLCCGIATKVDANTVQALAETYNNRHLNELFQKLSL